jgi:hypothetical protein
MKSSLIIIVFAGLLSSCASMKTAKQAQNFDDAYFVSSDIDKSSVYGKTNPALFKAPRANAGTDRNTRSVGQNYNDRLRNFGTGTARPNFAPALVYTPRMGAFMYSSPNFYNPYYSMGNPYYSYGYNPYMNYGCDPYYGYGYNPYYNPQWCYWNQYYSPYYGNYWGGNNAWGSGNNSGSGSSWGNNNNSGSSRNSFNNTGTRRNSYNTGLPASSQTTRPSYNSSSSSNSSSGGGVYTRPSSSNTSSGSSSGSTYTRPSSSGSTNSTGGGQSGSNTRRR